VAPTRLSIIATLVVTCRCSLTNISRHQVDISSAFIPSIFIPPMYLIYPNIMASQSYICYVKLARINKENFNCNTDLRHAEIHLESRCSVALQPANPGTSLNQFSISYGVQPSGHGIP
jgi:hypothetical protein